MSKTETLEKLLSFAFVMSENMVGLTKGNYDEATFIKKTYEYLHKYNVDLNSKQELEKALQRLEVIDNANPNEVLECFKRVWNDINAHNNFRQDFEDLTIIENYILKAQEQEKVLNIIFEKKVNAQLFIARNYKDYTNYITREPQYISEVPFTQEEFDLLKEYFEYER